MAPQLLALSPLGNGSLAAVLLGAFLTGLAGSPHCLVMCGPFAAACGRRPAGLAAWHLGRLLSYAALGAVAGLLGAAIPGPPWLGAAVGAALLLWFAAALAGFVPEPRLVLPGFARAGRLLEEGRGPFAQFAFGIANGFLPCGLVYSALALPVAVGHAAGGALAMLAFGAGTVPAVSVAAAGLRRITARSLAARRWLAAAVLAAGLWSIAARAGLIGRTHATLPGSSPGHSHSPPP
ncbi:MAG: sulfite exporter TauE/SafE family protein [Deltaproteobacteria bacterium]